jgi:hypothetical protein
MRSYGGPGWRNEGRPRRRGGIAPRGAERFSFRRRRCRKVRPGYGLTNDKDQDQGIDFARVRSRNAARANQKQPDGRRFRHLAAPATLFGAMQKNISSCYVLSSAGKFPKGAPEWRDVQGTSQPLFPNLNRDKAFVLLYRRYLRCLTPRISPGRRSAAATC